MADTKNLFDSLMSEKSTDCSENNSGCESEPIELPSIESVGELSLSVPVFETTKSEQVFKKPATKELKQKNKVLKPIQEEDCSEVSYDRQHYKDTFKRVRRAMKAMDISIGKNPIFVSPEKLNRKAIKLQQ